jgi:hypothetical protein
MFNTAGFRRKVRVEQPNPRSVRKFNQPLRQKDFSEGNRLETAPRLKEMWGSLALDRNKLSEMTTATLEVFFALRIECFSNM